MLKITEAQAGEYAKNLFQGETLIWDLGDSDQGAECIDVTVYNPEQVGGDGFAVVTCWLEDGQPYGEW